MGSSAGLKSKGEEERQVGSKGKVRKGEKDSERWREKRQEEGRGERKG